MTAKLLFKALLLLSYLAGLVESAPQNAFSTAHSGNDDCGDGHTPMYREKESKCVRDILVSLMEDLGWSSRMPFQAEALGRQVVDCTPTSGSCIATPDELRSTLETVAAGDTVALCDGFLANEEPIFSLAQDSVTICCEGNSTGCNFFGDGSDALLEAVGDSLSLSGLRFSGGASSEFEGGNVYIAGPGFHIIDSCTFALGTTSASNGNGGNLYVTTPGGVLIQDCFFSSGSAFGSDFSGGGGVAIELASQVFVYDSEFTNNEGSLGGAFYYGGDNITVAEIFLESNFFDANFGSAGGAICAENLGDSTFYITNNVFTNNTGQQAGGAGFFFVDVAEDTLVISENIGVDNFDIGFGCSGFLALGADQNPVCIGVDEEFGGSATPSPTPAPTSPRTLAPTLFPPNECGQFAALCENLSGRVPVQKTGFLFGFPRSSERLRCVRENRLRFYERLGWSVCESLAESQVGECFPTSGNCTSTAEDLQFELTIATAGSTVAICDSTTINVGTIFIFTDSVKLCCEGIRCVMQGNGTARVLESYGSDLTLQGITFQGGSTATYSIDEDGGNVRIDGGGAHYVWGCKFFDGISSNWGGQLYAQACDEIIIEDSLFQGGSAVDRGGGLATYNVARVNVTNTEFKTNEAAEGGALYFEIDGNFTSTLIIDRSSFDDNAAGFGGAFSVIMGFVVGSSVFILESEFTDNYGDVGGTGVVFDYLDDIDYVLEGNTAARNSASIGLACNDVLLFQNEEAAFNEEFECIGVDEDGTY